MNSRNDHELLTTSCQDRLVGRCSGKRRLGHVRLSRIGARRVMSMADGVGFIAALFTLLTFIQSGMVPMRLAAIGANLSFIAFGVLAACQPVLVLHVVLLPVNVFRLWTSLSLAGWAARQPSEPGCAGVSEGLI